MDFEFLCHGIRFKTMIWAKKVHCSLSVSFCACAFYFNIFFYLIPKLKEHSLKMYLFFYDFAVRVDTKSAYDINYIDGYGVVVADAYTKKGTSSIHSVFSFFFICISISTILYMVMVYNSITSNRIVYLNFDFYYHFCDILSFFPLLYFVCMLHDFRLACTFLFS